MLRPIPRDQVVTHAGERFEKYGCVMYTAVALWALLDADVFVCVPITDYEVGQPTLRYIKEHSGADLDVYLSREDTERQIRAAYGPRPQEELP